MRLARGPDDADVIRARLRALLAEGSSDGWVPGDAIPAAPDTVRPVGSETVPEVADEEAFDGGAPTVGRHRARAAVRLDPGRPGARALWVAAGAAVLVLLALTWRDRPTAAPVVPSTAPASSTELPTTTRTATAGEEPTPSPGTVVVSVVGRVVRPGLVTLPEGARVADAVEAAGGLLPGADQSTVNLAAPLADGQQVAVGVPGAAELPDPVAAPPQAGGPLDLNRAGVAELETLPGVGPVLAQRIVDHREQHGPFGSVDALQDVPGIGPVVFEGLADAVTV